MAFTLSKNTNYPAGVNDYDATTSPPTGPISAAGDSGTITTIPQPGVAAGAKLTDTTQQSATTSSSDSTVAGGGDSLDKSQVATYGPAGNALGYSIKGN